MHGKSSNFISRLFNASITHPLALELQQRGRLVKHRTHQKKDNTNNTDAKASNPRLPVDERLVSGPDWYRVIMRIFLAKTGKKNETGQSHRREEQKQGRTHANQHAQHMHIFHLHSNTFLVCNNSFET